MTGGDDLRVLDAPRDLRADERGVIEQLLEHHFVGRDEIRSQLATARVIAEGSGDSRTLRFAPPDTGAPRANTMLRVPVEAQANDEDGVPIVVLLHVVDGVVEELEVYRVDGQAIRQHELGALMSVSVNQEE
jgi:hypothetical protein